MNKRSCEVLALGFAAAAFLAACGGNSSTSPGSGTPQASSIEGTAAVGTALAQANVSIIDAAGASPCQEANIVTSGTGSYTCTLKSGETAPFFVSVTDPSGVVPTMVSVTTTTPTPGTPLVVNATPLTTAIIAQLASDHNALTVFASKTVDAAALSQLTTNVLAQLQPVLTSINAPANYNPFSSNITAASSAGAGNTADLVLDVVKVGTDVSGNITLSTVDNPTGVPMASATATAPALAPVTASVASLSVATQALATSFEQCFALPVAQRVLAVDTTVPYAQGGNTVTQADAKCQLADTSFLQNGYSAGQYFYGTLTSDNMTGAKFSVPEVTLYLPAAQNASAQDAAVLNIRYLDGKGQPGNFITVATNKAAAGASPVWVISGNQHPVEVLVRSTIRMVQQQAPVTQAPFNTTAQFSTFQTGIELFVNKDGPGSTGLTVARISGPGLPASGIVLNHPMAAIESQQSWLNIADKSGGSPDVLANQPNTCNCDIFWLERTQDISGAGATALRNNPNAGNTNNTAFVNWAHPKDYGAAVGATADQYVPFSSIAMGARYKVEVFYNGSATATHTFYKTLLTPIVLATRGANLAWNAPTSATLGILDPANATLAPASSSFDVSWTQNPAAEQVRLVQMFTGATGLTVNQGSGIAVPKGATSATIPAPSGLQFAALDSSGSSYRSVQMIYRTFDNSLKLAIYRFN